MTTREIIPQTFPFSWKCPECKKKHTWTWDYEDIPMVGDVLTMRCDNCGKDPEMICKLVKVK
jgi:C4-type Zn-finger protein